MSLVLSLRSLSRLPMFSEILSFYVNVCESYYFREALCLNESIGVLTKSSLFVLRFAFAGTRFGLARFGLPDFLLAKLLLRGFFCFCC